MDENKPKRSLIDRIEFWFAIFAVLGIATVVFIGSFMYAVVKRIQRSVPAAVVQVHHDSPVVAPTQLKGEGRIYFVQIGKLDSHVSLDQLAGWFRTKYGVQIQILPPIAFEDASWNRQRKQRIAERVLQQLRKARPELAQDPKAYLLAFTDEDLYSAQYASRFMFGLRGERVAIISTRHMHPSGSLFSWLESDQMSPWLRRFTLKEIAVLYWKLPLNGDPDSALVQGHGLDLRQMPEDIYESDLDPETSRYGRWLSGACIHFSYPAPASAPPSLDCSDLAKPVTEREDFFVELTNGFYWQQRADFSLDGGLPIEFVRITRGDWPENYGFGLGSMSTYDRYLTGEINDLSWVDLVLAHGGKLRLTRTTPGRGFRTDIAFQARPPLPLEYAGARMMWNPGPPERFDLTRLDGVVESYRPCANGGIPCFLMEMRDQQGHRLRIERDEQGNAARITSDGGFVVLEYDAAHRAIAAHDSTGRQLHYSYDDRGHLASVASNGGATVAYHYDAKHHITSVDVRADSAAAERNVIRTTYDASGRVTSVTLGDGSCWRIDYGTSSGSDDSLITVYAPGEVIYRLKTSANGVYVWRTGKLPA
jgi:YD repeat-containing protein